MKKYIIYILTVIVLSACSSAKKQTEYNQEHRLQFHFSPKEKWMNDPNGMFYLNGKYHFFYQHYPDSTVWGPMHWGHTISKDLIHWEEQPIALYPDSLGWIFSGSAVVDKNNTSGFGKNGKTPVVAIFTHHNPKMEKEGRNDFQYQSLAYSLDEGKTWVKYEGNPVVKNPGIRDFRDPKLMWYEQDKKWIMTLATLDRITFYSSPDLKNWTKESEFGQNIGAHGGVWECPDLFPLEHNGKTVWTLLVSINPGGPNGGSATQYFLGDFNGKEFTPYTTKTRWFDYGTDNYAGVTFDNTDKEKIFMGWMSNWQYAGITPSKAWRGAATLPRTLNIKTIDGHYFLSSEPIKALDQLKKKETILKAENTDLSGQITDFSNQFILQFSTEELRGFTLKLSNDLNDELLIGYDKVNNSYFIDRSKSGKTDFEAGFAKKIIGQRVSLSKNSDFKLVIDAASAELFADGGLTNITSIFFPNKPYTSLTIQNSEGMVIKNLSYSPLHSIWK